MEGDVKRIFGFVFGLTYPPQTKLYPYRCAHQKGLRKGALGKDRVHQLDDVLVNLYFHDLHHKATSQLAEKLAIHALAKVTGHKDTRILSTGTTIPRLMTWQEIGLIFPIAIPPRALPVDTASLNPDKEKPYLFFCHTDKTQCEQPFPISLDRVQPNFSVLPFRLILCKSDHPSEDTTA